MNDRMDDEVKIHLIWGIVLALLLVGIIATIIAINTVLSPQIGNNKQAIWEACLAHNPVASCQVSLGVNT